MFYYIIILLCLQVWSPFCVEGAKERFRTCYQGGAVSPKGNCAGEDVERELCSNEPIDGNWGLWGPWGQCSVTCGLGTRVRDKVNVIIEIKAWGQVSGSLEHLQIFSMSGAIKLLWDIKPLCC